MRFLSALFTGGVAASLCLFSSAAPAFAVPQAAPAAQQQAPAPPPAPADAAAPAVAPAPLKLESLPPDPHTPTPEEQAAQEAERKRAQIQRLAIAQVNWGTPNSTPGMTLKMTETGRKKTAEGTQITYRISGTGFTPDMKLTLLRWPLNASITPLMDGVAIDASGNAVCLGASAGSCGKTFEANAPIELTTTAAKGEAIRIALIAGDQKHGAATSAIPFPLVSQDKGCKLQVVLGSKDAELVLIQGEGFNTSLPFTMGSESYGEKKPLTAKPDANGHFNAAMLPWVTGHDTGDTVVYFQSDACTPTLSFHWGKGTYKVE